MKLLLRFGKNLNLAMVQLEQRTGEFSRVLRLVCRYSRVEYFAQLPKLLLLL